MALSMKMRVYNTVRSFVANEDGAELVEYALVMSVVTIASIVAVQFVGTIALADEQSNASRLQNSGVTIP